MKTFIPLVSIRMQHKSIMDACSFLQASKCMRSLKSAQKGMQSALKELAVREAKEAQDGEEKKKFAFIHK